MRTLLVDCYPDEPEWRRKLIPYQTILGRLGDLTTVDHRALSATTPTAGFGAVVISGSPVMLTRDPLPGGLEEFARGLDIPVLGVCFGHQVMGLVTGAELERDEFYEDWETVRVTERGELFAGMPGRLKVFESHAEFLTRRSVEAAGWQVMAESDRCPVEAMRHRERPFHCVQFHPERSEETGERVFENFLRRVAGFPPESG